MNKMEFRRKYFSEEEIKEMKFRDEINKLKVEGMRIELDCVTKEFDICRKIDEAYEKEGKQEELHKNGEFYKTITKLWNRKTELERKIKSLS